MTKESDDVIAEKKRKRLIKITRNNQDRRRREQVKNKVLLKTDAVNVHINLPVDKKQNQNLKKKKKKMSKGSLPTKTNKIISNDNNYEKNNNITAKSFITNITKDKVGSTNNRIAMSNNQNSLTDSTNGNVVSKNDNNNNNIKIISSISKITSNNKNRSSHIDNNTCNNNKIIIANSENNNRNDNIRKRVSDNTYNKNNSISLSTVISYSNKNITITDKLIMIDSSDPSGDGDKHNDDLMDFHNDRTCDKSIEINQEIRRNSLEKYKRTYSPSGRKSDDDWVNRMPNYERNEIIRQHDREMECLKRRLKKMETNCEELKSQLEISEEERSSEGLSLREKLQILEKEKQCLFIEMSEKLQEIENLKQKYELAAERDELTQLDNEQNEDEKLKQQRIDSIAWIKKDSVLRKRYREVEGEEYRRHYFDKEERRIRIAEERRIEKRRVEELKVSDLNRIAVERQIAEENRMKDVRAHVFDFVYQLVENILTKIEEAERLKQERVETTISDLKHSLLRKRTRDEEDALGESHRKWHFDKEERRIAGNKRITEERLATEIRVAEEKVEERRIEELRVIELVRLADSERKNTIAEKKRVRDTLLAIRKQMSDSAKDDDAKLKFAKIRHEDQLCAHIEALEGSIKAKTEIIDLSKLLYSDNQVIIEYLQKNNAVEKGIRKDDIIFMKLFTKIIKLIFFLMLSFQFLKFDIRVVKQSISSPALITDIEFLEPLLNHTIVNDLVVYRRSNFLERSENLLIFTSSAFKNDGDHTWIQTKRNTSIVSLKAPVTDLVVYFRSTFEDQCVDANRMLHDSRSAQVLTFLSILTRNKIFTTKETNKNLFALQLYEESVNNLNNDGMKSYELFTRIPLCNTSTSMSKTYYANTKTNSGNSKSKQLGIVCNASFLIPLQKVKLNTKNCDKDESPYITSKRRHQPQAIIINIEESGTKQYSFLEDNWDLKSCILLIINLALLFTCICWRLLVTNGHRSEAYERTSRSIEYINIYPEHSSISYSVNQLSSPIRQVRLNL